MLDVRAALKHECASDEELTKEGAVVVLGRAEGMNVECACACV